MKIRRKIFWGVAATSVPVLFVADMLTGSAGVSASEVWRALTGGSVSSEVQAIVLDIRLLKALTAMLAGVAVSVSGLMMQTLFRNPLAGPYVLGVSSGASLGAALFVLGLPAASLGSAAWTYESAFGTLGLAGAAWIGSAAVLAVILSASRRIKDIMVILILGMMIGAGIDAVVQILQYLSDESSLKAYVIWTMGSLGNVTKLQLSLLSGAAAVGLGLAIWSVKGLNLLLLGENYAVTTGLNVRRTRTVIFVATVLLAGTVTAFCGPLGFVGLAVPHLTRFISRSADHRTLLPGTVLCGAAVMLLCDIIAKSAALPINAITSLLGIPVIIAVVLRNRL